MNTLKKISIAMGVGLLLGIWSAGHAATANSNLTISVNVVASCSIHSSSLPFGGYQSKQLDQAGNLSVNCSNGTTYTVALDGGNTGSTASRALQGPANAQLSYALYQDAAHTKTWGNSGASELVSNIGNGVLQNIPVYGHIPAGQSPAAGVYGDVVGVTLSY